MNTIINFIKKLTSILILLLMLINMVSCSKAKTLDLKESHENCLKYYNEIKKYLDNKFENIEEYDYTDSFGSEENGFVISTSFSVDDKLKILLYLGNLYNREIFGISFYNGIEEYGDGRTLIDLSTFVDILDKTSGRKISQEYLNKIIKKAGEESGAKKTHDDTGQIKIFYRNSVDYGGNWSYLYEVRNVTNVTHYGDYSYEESLTLSGLTISGTKY